MMLPGVGGSYTTRDDEAHEQWNKFTKATETIQTKVPTLQKTIRTPGAIVRQGDSLVRLGTGRYISVLVKTLVLSSRERSIYRYLLRPIHTARTRRYTLKLRILP